MPSNDVWRSRTTPRGYWSDEDLLKGLDVSIALPKTMQGLRLLAPTKLKNESGQWARAWSWDEVMRVAFVQAIARELASNVKIGAVISAVLGLKVINQLLRVEEFEADFVVSDLAKETLFELRRNRRDQLYREAVIELHLFNRFNVFEKIVFRPDTPDKTVTHWRHLGNLHEVKAGKWETVDADTLSDPNDLQTKYSDAVLYLHPIADEVRRKVLEEF